jgi:hypothetical protein
LQEPLELEFAADEGAASPPNGLVQNPDQPEDRHRLGLPLQLDRLRLRDLHPVAHQTHGLLADKDLAGLSRLLEPRRHVHRIPGREPLRRAGHHLAGIDTDPAADP